MNTRVAVTLLGLFAACASVPAAASEPAAQVVPVDTSRGDAVLAEYFRCETARLAERCLADVRTLEEWNAQRDTYRKQLFEMLGLDPLPERTPLNPVVTGTVEHEAFTVEKLHFQSRPGLYVTGNLYVPRQREGKLPAILYVCGHGRVVKDGVSYGNKTSYQHHGAWFARNGYVCLVIDTIQLGELEGIHHGTYRYGMWWWHSRGYTPAGVEAWNCIRALDYLQSRPEVDPERIGVTGRSGGGAYSWWIAALDERIKAAVPVAGITNLKNHVVDGCVEGHCDCMYQVNTFGWDFAQVAALVAPRPLLISNTDKDRIFPLDGVVDVYNQVRRIYELHGKLEHIGLNISEGPHKDMQELQINAFHWLNRFLKGEDPQIETAAVKFFEPEQLKVFQEPPADEITTRIHDTFVPVAETPAPPRSSEQWQRLRDAWQSALREKCFRGWPEQEPPLKLQPVFSADNAGIRLSAYDFASQEPIVLRLYVAHRAGLRPEELELVVLNALDDQGWTEFLAMLRPGFAEQLQDQELPPADDGRFESQRKMFQSFAWGMAYVAPRGIGPTAWSRDERKRTQLLRRFALLGQTADGMRVWDIQRAAAALRSIDGLRDVPLWLQGEREMAGNVLYASLFIPQVRRLDLHRLSGSHRDGPHYLNVLRFLDVPQAVALAAERSQVRIYQEGEGGWDYPLAVAAALHWDAGQIQIREVSQAAGK